MSDKPLLPPNCPTAFRVIDHVPMAHVFNLERSLEFYSLLGFACDSRYSHRDGTVYFASLISQRARLMLTLASGPVDPSQQAVLFYMYSNDVKSLRDHLLDHGLNNAGQPPGEKRHEDLCPPKPPDPAVFDLRFPFYMPHGELRLHDPDGYCILVGQLEPGLARP